MSKPIITGISIVVVTIIAIIVYRRMVPPKIQFIMYDALTHSGEFSFGGVTNTFGDKSFAQVGRGGWVLNVTFLPNGTSRFDLLKNDTFIKTLAVK